jgi:hypothetical protein
MSLSAHGVDWHAKTVRAWHLAILRFAVTLDNADRLAVMAIANEIDRLGPRHAGESAFDFFRRTSAELCAAIPRPNELTSSILQRHLARIDDDRIKRVFAAATGADQPKVTSVSKPIKRDNGLWRGLSRDGHRSRARGMGWLREITCRERMHRQRNASRAIWARDHACNAVPGDIS